MSRPVAPHAAKGDQQRAPTIGRDDDLPISLDQTNALNPRHASICAGGVEFQRGPVQQLAKERQAQGFVHLIAMTGQQGQGTHHTVVVRDGIEEPCGGPGLHQPGQVGPIAVPAGQGHRRRPIGQIQHRGRKLSGDAPLPVAGEVVAQHHGSAPDGLRQALVRTGQGIRLGEHGVHAQQADVVPEKPVDQIGHPIPGPGPAPDLGQALFIDVDDDDALVERARHGRAQASVLDLLVQAVQQRHRQYPAGVQDKQTQQKQQRCRGEPSMASGGAHDLRHPPGRPACRQARSVPRHCWMNCIWVPASSIRSPWRRLTASEPIGVPLTVGGVAPSTSATT